MFNMNIIFKISSRNLNILENLLFLKLLILILKKLGVFVDSENFGFKYFNIVYYIDIQRSLI